MAAREKTASSAPDSRFMRMALRLAEKGRGTTSPNPLVGAVIVRGGRVIGRGWHQRAGEPHAEVNAVRDARQRGHSCQGATLYVTLEPCSTHGRTPPCTGLILREKFARVVIGTLDPNPLHAGRALPLLRAAGVMVRHGVLEKDCRAANRIFNHWITTGRPYVIGKLAVSRDGFLSGQSSRWITGLAARRRGHALRAEVDAILVGVNTVLADNPSLTIRHGLRPDLKPQPWRIVLDSRGRLPAGCTLLTDRFRDRTWALTAREVEHGPDGLKLQRVLEQLAGRGVTSVLVEGGLQVLLSFARQDLLDEFHLHRGPRSLGVHCKGLSALPLIRLLQSPPWTRTASVAAGVDAIRIYLRR